MAARLGGVDAARHVVRGAHARPHDRALRSSLPPLPPPIGELPLHHAIHDLEPQDHELPDGELRDLADDPAPEGCGGESPWDPSRARDGHCALHAAHAPLHR